MQNSSSDLLINSKYAIVSIDIYFRIGAQPGTDAPPNYIGRHIVLDREAESIKIDELENIRKDIARTYFRDLTPKAVHQYGWAAFVIPVGIITNAQTK